MGNRNNIKIIHEDNHLLVVEKPPNMLTQGDQTGDMDLLSALKEDIRQRYNKPGNVFLGLVHRLDRPVGGAMVFAKTSKAASRLSDQIRTREFDKTYLAVVHGVPDKLTGTLVNFLVKDVKTNTVRVVDSPSDMSSTVTDSAGARRQDTQNGDRDYGIHRNYGIHGNTDGNKNINAEDSYSNAKKAVLDYTVKGADDQYSLVRIKLHTGRPHQIRVQLAAAGHPLYGDQKYGASLNKPGMQLALWSVEVGFIHPTLKEYVSFSSNPPSAYPWNLFT